MANYSKAEKDLMVTAFVNLFKVNKLVAQSEAAIAWMVDAPAAIVEYDGKIGKEGRMERDRRMQMYEVYDGQISNLVSYLRNHFKQYKHLQKWELIFQICSEISDVKKVIEQAERQVAFGEDEVSAEPQTIEEPLDSQSASTEESMPVKDTSTEEPVQVQEVAVTVEETTTEDVIAEEKVEEENVPVEETISHEPEVSVQADVVSQKETSIEVTPAVDAQPSGNVQETIKTPLFNKSNNHNMEDSKMGNVDELLAKAAGASADAATTQKMPSAANVSGVKIDEEAARLEIIKSISGQAAERSAWTKSNTVTALVSERKPNALRVKSSQGLASTKTTDEEAKEDIQTKINKFIALVSGTDNITVEQFESMDNAARFRNVVEKDGAVDKAAAIYELLKRMYQAPRELYEAYIPSADAVSYPTKGYVINGNPMPTEEFIATIIDNSVGAIYAEGHMTADGRNKSEDSVIFSVGTTTKTEKAQAQGVTTAKRSTKVMVVKAKNKKDFIKGGNNIVYLKTQENTEEDGRASFKAAIQVKGELMPATVSVYHLENGQRVERSTKDDGTKTYKTKVASVAVSVPVAKVVNSIDAQFTGGLTEMALVFDRWGLKQTAEKIKGDYGTLTQAGQMPIVDVMAMALAGEIKNDVFKGSETMKALKATVDATIAAQAAESAADLA